MIVRFEIVGVVGEVERLHNMRKSRWDPYSWEAVENLHARRLIPIPSLRNRSKLFLWPGALCALLKGFGGPINGFGFCRERRYMAS